MPIPIASAISLVLTGREAAVTRNFIAAPLRSERVPAPSFPTRFIGAFVRSTLRG